MVNHLVLFCQVRSDLLASLHSADLEMGIQLLSTFKESPAISENLNFGCCFHPHGASTKSQQAADMRARRNRHWVKYYFKTNNFILDWITLFFGNGNS